MDFVSKIWRKRETGCLRKDKFGDFDFCWVFFFEDESGLMLRKLYKCLGKGQGRQKSLKFQTKIQRLFQWNLNHSKIEANLINQEIFQAFNSIIYQRIYSRPIFHTNCITNIKKLIQFLRIPLYFLFLETQKIWNNRNSYF